MPASPWRGRQGPEAHGTKREAVVRAAAKAFNRNGYHNTSLDDIAAALEVTKPTLYYYVKSKEQLLFECFRTGLEPIRAAFRNDTRPRRHSGPRTPHHRAAALCRGDCIRIWLVHGASRRSQSERADAGPRQSAEVRNRPRHPATDSRRDSRRLDRPLRSEDDCLCSGGCTQLDCALVPRQSGAQAGRDCQSLRGHFQLWPEAAHF